VLRYRALQLGEGGYAFVYLVREVPTAQQPLVDDAPLALKRVRGAGRSAQEAASLAGCGCSGHAEGQRRFCGNNITLCGL
jgi:hypothetical protein